MLIPVSCSNAPAITITSASRSLSPWSLTAAGATPPLTASRRIRRAMLATIWMWTRLWSDIPSRSEVTCCMYQRAATSGSALAWASRRSSLRLPRVGTLTHALPIRAARLGRPSATAVSLTPGPERARVAGERLEDRRGAAQQNRPQVELDQSRGEQHRHRDRDRDEGRRKQVGPLTPA